MKALWIVLLFTASLLAQTSNADLTMVGSGRGNVEVIYDTMFHYGLLKVREITDKKVPTWDVTRWILDKDTQFYIEGREVSWLSVASHPFIPVDYRIVYNLKTYHIAKISLSLLNL
jgi:hypothetical protein